MRLKAFTVVEMVIAVIIVGVLATLAINAYQGFIEGANAKVCEVNQEAIVTFLNNYAMEHDIMPSDYSALPKEGLEKAYASVLRRKGAWKIRLAHFIAEWNQRGLAYAQFGTELTNLVRGNTAVLHCPKDVNGSYSYGFNKNLLFEADGDPISSRAFRDMLKDPNMSSKFIVADCDNPTFASSSDLAIRHTNYKVVIGDKVGYPIAINRGGVTSNDMALEISQNESYPIELIIEKIITHLANYETDSNYIIEGQ